MKRILRTEKRITEKAEYTCDFTGKKLSESVPVHVEIWCGYHSDRDGITYRLHLCESAADELMVYLRLKNASAKIAGCRQLLPRRDPTETRPNWPGGCDEQAENADCFQAADRVIIFRMAEQRRPPPSTRRMNPPRRGRCFGNRWFAASA